MTCIRNDKALKSVAKKIRRLADRAIKSPHEDQKRLMLKMLGLICRTGITVHFEKCGDGHDLILGFPELMSTVPDSQTVIEGSGNYEP